MTGILCPAYGSEDTGVRDSRPTDACIRRRRCCSECSFRFTTAEVVIPDVGNVTVLRRHETDAANPHLRIVETTAIDDPARLAERIAEAVDLVLGVKR